MILDKNEVFIIAEAGVNHDGDLDVAFQLIDAAKDSGANAVKFQTFKHGECTGKYAFMTDYQKQGVIKPDESRYEMSGRLALPFQDFDKLKSYCEEKDILFMSTPDGSESLNYLVDNLGVQVIKVASTEVTNLKFLKQISEKSIPTILSTGLSNLGEVERAIDVMLPHLADKLTVLHCTSEYPAPDDQVNLLAMKTMASSFGLPVGYSDHTIGSEASISAVALGARVIEKHFTLSRHRAGPDHQASLEPDELKTFVNSLRRVEQMLGDGIKRPTAAEVANMQSIRRSIVAGRVIEQGTVLTAEMLTAKRPGTGIKPSLLENIVGMRVNRRLEEDEVLTWDDLRWKM